MKAILIALIPPVVGILVSWGLVKSEKASQPQMWICQTVVRVDCAGPCPEDKRFKVINYYRVIVVSAEDEIHAEVLFRRYIKNDPTLKRGVINEDIMYVYPMTNHLLDSKTLKIKKV